MADDDLRKTAKKTSLDMMGDFGRTFEEALVIFGPLFALFGYNFFDKFRDGAEKAAEKNTKKSAIIIVDKYGREMEAPAKKIGMGAAETFLKSMKARLSRPDSGKDITKRFFDKLPDVIREHPAMKKAEAYLGGLLQRAAPAMMAGANGLSSALSRAAPAVEAALGGAHRVMKGLTEELGKSRLILGAFWLQYAGISDIQRNLKKTAIESSELWGAKFYDMAIAVGHVSTNSQLTQDRAVELMSNFSSLGMVAGKTGEELFAMTNNAAILTKHFGYSSQEAALLYYGLSKAGLGFKEIDRLTQINFESGAKFNVSLAEQRENMGLLTDHMVRFGLTGATTAVQLVASLNRMRGAYKELGLDAGQATEWIRKMSQTGTTEQMQQMRILSAFSGQTMAELNRMLEQDPGALVITRNTALVDSVTRTFGADDVFKNFKDLGTDQKDAINLIAQRFAQKLGVGEEEARNMMGRMRQYVADNQKRGLSTQQLLDEFSKKTGKGEDKGFQKQVDDANQTLSEFLTEIRNVGQALLVSVGVPLMSMLKPVLSGLVTFFRGIGELVGRFSGVFKALGVVIAAVLGILLFKFAFVTAVIAGVVVVVGYLIDIWKSFRDQTFDTTTVLGSALNLLGGIIDVLVSAAGLVLKVLWFPFGVVFKIIGAVLGALWDLVKPFSVLVTGPLNAFSAGLRAVSDFVTWIGDGLGKVGDGIAFVVSGPLLLLKMLFSAIWDVVTAVASTIGTVLMVPIRAVGDAVKAVAGWWSSLFDGVSDTNTVLGSLWSVVKSVAGVIGSLAGLILKVLWVPFELVLKSIGAVLRVLWSFTAPVRALLGALWEIAGPVLKAILSPFALLFKLVGAIASAVGTLLVGALNWVAGIFTGIGDTLENWQTSVDNFTTSVAEAVAGPFQFVHDLWMAIPDAIDAALNKIKEWIPVMEPIVEAIKTIIDGIKAIFDGRFVKGVGNLISKIPGFGKKGEEISKAGETQAVAVAAETAAAKARLAGPALAYVTPHMPEPAAAVPPPTPGAPGKAGRIGPSGTSPAPRQAAPELPTTTPSNVVPLRKGAQGGVYDSILGAANKTGVDPQYLLKTAYRESAFRPEAKAEKGSATGLFQFIDSTWLATLKKHGAEAGLDTEKPYTKQQLLDLRKDPKIASLMGAYLTQDNAKEIGSNKQGDLYLAHFLGANAAKKVVAGQDVRTALGANYDTAVKNNPFMKDMDSDQLRAWADKKMADTSAFKENVAKIQAVRENVAAQSPGATPVTANVNATLDPGGEHVRILREQTDLMRQSENARRQDVEFGRTRATLNDRSDLDDSMNYGTV